MMSDDENPEPGHYASPPCFAHELAEGFDGAFAAVDADQRRDVARWRKAERQRLIAARLAFTADERRDWSWRIAEAVAVHAGDFGGRTVSFYWPFRGEPDLRALMETVTGQGGTVALPVVIEKARPLVFRAWSPGEPLEKGVWGIPVPRDGPEVTPDVVLAPVVGFDDACFRLGYGGGFFDRTLASLERKPVAIGVGFACAHIATIFPQPHDIPLDVVITQDGVAARREGGTG